MACYTILMTISEKIEAIELRINAILTKKNLNDLILERDSIESRTLQSDFWNNNEDAQKTMQVLGGLKTEVADLQNLQKSIKDIKDLAQDESVVDIKDQTDQEDNEIVQMINLGLEDLENKVEEIELTTFLSGKFDTNNAIVKIIAGQGGTEACDWASMVLRMYTRYANSKGWSVQITDKVDGTEAGIASAELLIEGRYAYGYLKHEHGTHRLVRNSPFNAQGLRQTSFVGVEVLPEVNEDIDIEVRDEDIEFNAIRSSGAGGQNVNKVASKVRIVHKPSGIVVEASSQRTQHANRDAAMRLLKARLYEIEENKKKAELASNKGEYKIAGWGNQIRNYVLQPYKLVKDVRTEVETANTDGVLDGDIQTFIDAEIRQL
jgi:peptide chain release factor 2